MTSGIRVKICGLTRPQDLSAVVAAGATYAGFVFFEKSPRHVDLTTALALATAAPPGLAKVALTVDAGDDELLRIVESVPLDMLQLHGAESPARVAEIRARYGLPVMKAVGVASEADLAALVEYGRVADQLL
ncbi:MAG: phosphoribosylanthranilate isomerase, partial [Pikeienuella sp.]